MKQLIAVLVVALSSPSLNSASADEVARWNEIVAGAVSGQSNCACLPRSDTATAGLRPRRDCHW